MIGLITINMEFLFQADLGWKQTDNRRCI